MWLMKDKKSVECASTYVALQQSLCYVVTLREMFMTWHAHIRGVPRIFCEQEGSCHNRHPLQLAFEFHGSFTG